MPRIVSALFLSSLLLACDPESNPGDAGTGGDSGSGGTSGNGGAGGAGSGGGGGMSGTGGDGGAGSGGSGGTSGTGGGGGGTSGTGGCGGMSGTGGSGGTSGTGGSGGTGGDEATPHISLLGPATPNQAPVIIGAERLHERAGVPVEQIAQCGDGSILMYGMTVLMKLTPTGTVAWNLNVITEAFPVSAQATIYAAAFTEDCSTLLGGVTTTGLAGYTYVGAGDAFVLRIDTNGDVTWTHQWGSSSTDTVTGIAVRDDGSFFTAGSCGGQVPGSAPSLSGKQFVQLFEADGDVTSLLQHAAPTASYQVSSGRLRPAGDGFYRSGDGMFQMLSSSGVPGASFLVHGVFVSPSGDFGPQAVMGTPTAIGHHDSSQAYYALYPVGVNGGAAGLDHFDATGELRWIGNGVDAEHVIDEVEGTTWTGRFMALNDLLVTSDALYVVGDYSNTYRNGSAPPPATSPTFVARYDLDGERVWFMEFLIDPSPAAGAPRRPFVTAPLFINNEGNLTLHMRLPVLTAWYTLELDTATGDVL